MVNGQGMSYISDGIESLTLVARLSWHRNLSAWLYVPIGILILLLTCFGVNSLVGLGFVSFPASVALLVVLFLGLMICDVVIGERKTKSLVNYIGVPAGWALKYINIFFTPSFVLLPLSPPISGTEMGKIIAVFVIGFLVMVAVTAYLTRGVQLLLGSSKRAITERAEEMGNEDDSIPLAESRQPRLRSEVSQPSGLSTPALVVGTSTPLPKSGNITPPTLADELARQLTAPLRTQDPSRVRGTGGPPEQDALNPSATVLNPPGQSPLPLTRSQRWASSINRNFDRLTYLLIFLFIGIPIYYTTGYPMPAQLAFNVLAYFAALSLPPNWRQFLHPVLVSSAITVLGIWILGVIRGETLVDVLHSYKTGSNYLSLWHHSTNLPLPGAGDIFGSILDASIVSLALPMFSYRHELQRHFFAIVIPNVAIATGSLFGYPALCYAIGISSERSLAFASRSLTLALATPATKNLGGDTNTNAALAIMSGIMGVLVGQRILKWLKIPEDDYVTRGVTLGGNSSAIATALLLVTDPRAAALSSLSMSLFGIITLALTSIPPIVKAIDSLVDL